MSIAEKLTTVAENVPKVYKAGQDSMVDPDKIIPKSTSGNPVYLDDVSEIPHDVGITLTSDSITDFSDVNVTVCGKNILHTNLKKFALSGAYEIRGDNSLWLERRAVSFQGAHISFLLGKASDFAGKTLYLSIGNEAYETTCSSGLILYKNDLSAKISDLATFGTSANFCKATIGSGYTDEMIGARIYLSGIPNNYEGVLIENIMAKIGDSQIDYEPYNGTTYTANADGTVEGVKSLSPYMNIYSDADVDISVDYHKSYGMQTGWDRFWDSIQCKGARTNFQNAFGVSETIRDKTLMPWNDEIFCPKYDLKPTNAYRMFQSTGIENFKRCLAKNNVVFDLSNCKTEVSVSMTFYQNYMLELPEINLSNVSGRLIETIRDCASLKKVDKVILASDGSQTFTNTFLNNTSLTDITVEGVIGSTISFRDSPLTPESMKSIISCLKDYSAESTDVYTLTFKEDCWTALEADSTAPDGKTWREYVETTLGWLT